MTAIIFSDTTEIWNKIKDAYTGSFRELVFGGLQPEKDILKYLTTLADRLKLFCVYTFLNMYIDVSNQ